METKQESKTSKTRKQKISTVAVRVKRETKRRLQTEMAKINKKTFGRSVHLDALILLLLGRLTEQDIITLQEQSLSNADRLERQYREHVRKHGNISKDTFVGIVLGSYSNLSIKERNPQIGLNSPEI